MNNKRLSDIEIEIMRYAAGGMTGNKTYHQVRDKFMPMDSESMGYANGGGVGSMMKPKRVNFRGGGSYQGGSGVSGSAESKGMGGSGSSYSGGGGYSSSSNPSGNVNYGNAARDFVQTLNNNNAIAANQAGTKFEPYRGGSRPKGFFAPNGGLSSLTRNINPMSLLTGLISGNPLGILASLFGKGFKGLKGLNSKLQNSDFGRSKTLVDYFDAKKYGGIDARNLAAQKNMDDAAAITARLEGNNVKANVIGPNGQPITGGMAPNDFEIGNPGGMVQPNDFEIGDPSQYGLNSNAINEFGNQLGGMNLNDYETGNPGGMVQPNDFLTGNPSQYGLNSNSINEFATSPQFRTSLIDEFGDNRNINMDEFATQNNIDNRLMQEYLTNQSGFQQPITASQIDEFGDNRNINMNEFAGNDIQMQNYLSNQANYNADPFGNPNMDPRVTPEEYGLVGNNGLGNTINNILPEGLPGISVPRTYNRFSNINNDQLPGNDTFAGNYSQNAVSNQLYDKDYDLLDPFDQQKLDSLIEQVGTKSTGELARNGGIMGYNGY
jgi:hypothetical protein